MIFVTLSQFIIMKLSGMANVLFLLVFLLLLTFMQTFKVCTYNNARANNYNKLVSLQRFIIQEYVVVIASQEVNRSVNNFPTDDGIRNFH